METTQIKLENGQILSSGLEDNAIVSVKLTRAVNSETELAFGAVCTAMAEITLICRQESPIAQGETFTLMEGNRQIGIFTAEKPQWVSAHRVKIIAYDPIVKLDQDISLWLAELSPWPVTLRDLAEAVCLHCGVSLEDAPFPNQDFPAKPFSGKDVTGRRVLSWIAEAAGRFCRANDRGDLIFDWYRKTAKTIGPDQLQADHYYFQGSLELADYETAPIEKIQIRWDSQDVGTIYPDIGTANTYVVQGNPLLRPDEGQELLPLAQSLYEQLQEVLYTPCQVKVAADTGLMPGDIVTVIAGNGRTATVYLMESSRSGAAEIFRCVGSANRDSISMLNRGTLEALSGKVLRLQTDVDGLRAENADAAGNYSVLSVTVDAIENQVAGQSADIGSVKEQLTTLHQDKESLQLQVQTIRTEGVDRIVTTTGYSFSEEGLRIKKIGMEMENLLDHTGMYISRNGQPILQANNEGVVARDVTVENYLVVGNHARLEDYNGGTACFYI